MKALCILVALSLAATVPQGHAEAQYALNLFRRYTGLSVQPATSFVLCRGATTNYRTCRPNGSGWQQVENVQEYALPGNINAMTPADEVAAAISAAYMGVGYGLNDQDGQRSAAMVCATPEGITALDRYRNNPITVKSSVLQAVEAQALQDAMIRFSAALNGIQLSPAARARAEGEFRTALRRELNTQTNQSTTVRWVLVTMSATRPQLESIEGIRECREWGLTDRGSLINGIAGMVLMSNAGTQDYVTSTMFDQSARVALEAAGTPASPALGEVLLNASGQWAQQTSRRVRDQISYELRTPVFYPFWVRFTRISQ